MSNIIAIFYLLVLVLNILSLTGADVTNLKLSKKQMKFLTENHHWLADQRDEILDNVKNREWDAALEYWHLI